VVYVVLHYSRSCRILSGFDVNKEFECGWTPLLLASSIANVEIVTRLLEGGADINKTIDCHTPLMLACNNSKNIETRIASCAQLLLKHGVNVNAFDKKRRTAIMMAANNGHARTVELLLPLVDRDAEDNQRWDVRIKRKLVRSWRVEL
jgi:ankyrin repeat/SAM/basic leucine zipper domain-containing protein 1